MPIISGGNVIDGGGASGTFVGRAVVGSLLIDTTGGVLYIATSATTGASVTWQVVGAQT